MEPVLKLLRELVALPSVNPAFLPPGDVHAGERRMADFLAAQAGVHGLDVDLQEVLPDRFNLWVRLEPRGRVRRRLVLAAHMDTVGGLELPGRLFIPRIAKDRLYGRGACDTKGSVAAFFTALAQVAGGSHRPQNTEIFFIGLIDEENGQEGSRAVVKRKLKADLAIVGEPTLLKVVTAHKGDLWLRLETEGRAAHGATPELGRNAVHEMARIVDFLETGYRTQLERRSHPLLGKPTINVGGIKGGLQPNVVPAQCTAWVDRRTLPGEMDSDIIRELRAALRAQGFKAAIASTKNGPCPPLETNSQNSLVSELFKAAGQTKPEGVRYFCDAAILAGGGTPSIVFGPGDIAQAHTADEWISIASLNKSVQVLTRFLESQP
jgi:acetylornithine deacetylase/succinyl-diaminopimelate desuccinylase-like protein